ncbi:MAG: phosphoglycolate phosphatase [Pseudomonadota bacterium]
MDASQKTSASLAGWTIVFDLDGTLVESAPDLLNALNHTIAPLGLPAVELEQIRTMIGHGAKAMIRAALEQNQRDMDQIDMDGLWSRFIAHYEENIAVDSHVFDGVEAAFGELKAEGAMLCVCTNKTQALTDRLLSELSLTHWFEAVVGADSVPAKKPDGGHILETVSRSGGQPSRAIMIGDSRTDEKAAQNAGLPFIFVPFGYEAAPVEDIVKADVLHHYSELLGRIRAVAG